MKQKANGRQCPIVDNTKERTRQSTSLRGFLVVTATPIAIIDDLCKCIIRFVMMMMDALYTKWGLFWEKIRGENSPPDNPYSERLSGNICKANK